MNTEQILAALIAERDRLNSALNALGAPTKRRGRPPKNAQPLVATATVSNGRRGGMSAAARKAHSKRMKAYWAAKKKAAAKKG